MRKSEIQITRITKENETELFDVAGLKQLDDSECVEAPTSVDEALEKVESLYTRGSDFWIARIKATQQAIGYAIGIILGTEECPYYRSQGIFIIKELRGKNIGSILRESQIAYAKEWGCKNIVSNVAGNNKPSIRFLQKTGFIFTPRGEGYMVEKEI